MAGRLLFTKRRGDRKGRSGKGVGSLKRVSVGSAYPGFAHRRVLGLIDKSECEQCAAGGCRLRRGGCTWRSTETFADEMDRLRTNDPDAWAFLRALVARSRGVQGLGEHHVSPMRVPSKHRMGELKARGKDGEMHRLYYGEPDQQENLVVALCLRVKRGFLRNVATTRGQDHQVRQARDIFMKWLRVNGMTSGD